MFVLHYMANRDAIQRTSKGNVCFVPSRPKATLYRPNIVWEMDTCSNTLILSLKKVARSSDTRIIPLVCVNYYRGKPQIIIRKQTHLRCAIRPYSLCISYDIVIIGKRTFFSLSLYLSRLFLYYILKATGSVSVFHL